MKTLRLFGMTIMMVLVASCFTACSNSSDDDGEDGGGGGNYKDMIIGRWLLTEAFDSEGNTISFSVKEDGFGFEFDSSGTFTYYYGGYDLNNGKSWAKIWDNGQDRDFGTYRIEGNSLNYKVSDGSSSFTIVNLTKDRLKLRQHGTTFSLDRFSY